MNEICYAVYLDFHLMFISVSAYFFYICFQLCLIMSSIFSYLSAWTFLLLFMNLKGN